MTNVKVSTHMREECVKLSSAGSRSLYFGTVSTFHQPSRAYQTVLVLISISAN
jgi:hypothetical protein